MFQQLRLLRPLPGACLQGAALQRRIRRCGPPAAPLRCKRRVSARSAPPGPYQSGHQVRPLAVGGAERRRNRRRWPDRVTLGRAGVSTLERSAGLPALSALPGLGSGPTGVLSGYRGAPGAVRNWVDERALSWESKASFRPTGSQPEAGEDPAPGATTRGPTSKGPWPSGPSRPFS